MSGKTGSGAVLRQRLVEIVFDGRVELELALIDELHYGVGEYSFGERSAVHQGVGIQRISVRVTDAVSIHIADLSAIDHGDGESVGMGARENRFCLGVDRRTAGDGLRNSRTGEADGGQQRSNMVRSNFPRTHGEEVLSRLRRRMNGGPTQAYTHGLIGITQPARARFNLFAAARIEARTEGGPPGCRRIIHRPFI